MEITGIVHAHSTYSYDAKMSLPELKALFQTNGISFVCMTEHTDELTAQQAEKFVHECAALSDESFLFIPGFEVPYTHAHILMIGMRGFYSVYAPTIEELMPWATAARFVVLAHPVRNDFIVDEGLLSVLDGIEVWNQQYEGKRVPRRRSLTLLKDLRSKKPKLVAVGGVDFHRKEHMGTPNVVLEVSSLTEENILSKLASGDFTVVSDRAAFRGDTRDIETLKRDHAIESAVSVGIINSGKCVNTILATLGITLPKSLKQRIRRRL